MYGPPAPKVPKEPKVPKPPKTERPKKTLTPEEWIAKRWVGHQRILLDDIEYTTGAKRKLHLALLWARQEGLCGVCTLELGDDVVIDHDHATGYIRGLLHNKCNLLLGFANDDAKLLNNAARYLLANRPWSDVSSE